MLSPGLVIMHLLKLSFAQNKQKKKKTKKAIINYYDVFILHHVVNYISLSNFPTLNRNYRVSAIPRNDILRHLNKGRVSMHTIFKLLTTLQKDSRATIFALLEVVDALFL